MKMLELRFLDDSKIIQRNTTPTWWFGPSLHHHVVIWSLGWSQMSEQVNTEEGGESLNGLRGSPVIIIKAPPLQVPGRDVTFPDHSLHTVQVALTSRQLVARINISSSRAPSYN